MNFMEPRHVMPSRGIGNPINPRMLLLHQILNGMQAHPGPDPNGGGGGTIHGFGPGGAVIGHPGGPTPGVGDMTSALAENFGGSPGMQPNYIQPPSGNIDSGYNPAQYQRATGNTQQAAADWEAHHPGAMRSGHLPPWIEQYLASTVAGAHVGQVSGAHERAHQLARQIARRRGGRGVRQSLRNIMPPSPAPPSMQAPPPTYS